MPRRSEKRDTAKAEYIARREKGEKVSLKRFAEEIGVPFSTVRNWKSTDRWDDGIKRKRGGQPKNKNAKGNPGGGAPKGNRNAMKDGAYSRIFFSELSKEELDFVEKTPQSSGKLMYHELQVLLLREKRILDAIVRYEKEPDDAVYTTSVMDMRKPGPTEDGDMRDGQEQQLGMYTKESPHERIMKLQEALYKVQGRIATITNALRQSEEFGKRAELERERLEIMRMRATGVVEVEEDDALHEQGDCEVFESI